MVDSPRRFKQLIRTDPIQIHVNGHFSACRDVLVPIDDRISMEEHLIFEEEVRKRMAHVWSIPESPLGRVLMMTIQGPRDDTEDLTSEVDDCISAVNHRMLKYRGQQLTYM